MGDVACLTGVSGLCQRVTDSRWASLGPWPRATLSTPSADAQGSVQFCSLCPEAASGTDERRVSGLVFPCPLQPHCRAPGVEDPAVVSTDCPHQCLVPHRGNGSRAREPGLCYSVTWLQTAPEASGCQRACAWSPDWLLRGRVCVWDVSRGRGPCGVAEDRRAGHGSLRCDALTSALTVNSFLRHTGCGTRREELTVSPLRASHLKGPVSRF